MPLAERLDQLDLTRQVIRVIRADAIEFIHQFLGDQLRCGMFHPVDHAMSHSLDRFKTFLLFEPINQEIRC